MENSHTIEQTLDSREVAEMVEKQHKDLMRDIKRYIKQMHQANSDCGGERNLAPTEFFRESTYQTAQNKQLPCYRITKKGCEFIAHKLTGTKGTAFTARYINRFHEMEDVIADKELVQQLGNIELANLQASVKSQEKILESINRKLSGSMILGISNGNSRDRYRREIVKIIASMQDEKALCKVYTFAKYVPQQLLQ